MPDNASPVKIQAVKQNGGIVHLCKPTQADREAGLADLVSGGYLPIPPYDHVDIIAGQGTACLELLQQVPDLDVVIAPVGGGGLIGGTAIVAHDRGVKVYAAEPEGAADTAESFATGERAEHWKPETICDGLRAIVGVRNFALIRRFVGDVITADDGQTRQGMLWFWQQLRMLIEPSSAVALAAIKSRPDLFAGRRVGVIITGANIDPEDWLSLVGGLQSE